MTQDLDQSLLVVVSYGYKASYFSSILQLEAKENNHEYAAHLTSEGRPKIKRSSSLSSLETQLNQKEYVAHLSQPQGYPPIRWVFSLASSAEDLCMVPDWGPRNYEIGVQLHGFIFNLRTKKCKSIKHPGGSRFYKYVVALGGHIYFMAHPCCHNYAPEPFFARYNPLKDSWETLEPFPDHAIVGRCNGLVGIIVATAVWDDTILLNLDGCEIWAYDVGRNRWYHVYVKQNLCYSIVGEAVVLENTIYALTDSYKLVLALSIKREEINGDLVFKCSLLWEILVPGMEQNKFMNQNSWWRTRHLVHLGKDNLCLVQSCYSYDSIDYQPIQLTNIKLKGEKSMTVTDICVHKLKILQNEQFKVQLCFSLPEYKTTALKEGKRFVFDFNPFPEDCASKLVFLYKGRPLLNVHATSELFQDNDSSQTNIIDEHGHSIYVRKLPPDATVRQLEKGLKKFGPIKRDRIQVGKNKKGKCFAFVEFESAISKQRAIQASTIRIGGCPAEILEKR